MGHLLPRLSPILLLSLSLSVSPLLLASEEGENLRAADAALNSSYKEVLEAMPSAAAKARLRDAQRAWVAFRDAEVALHAGLPGATGNLLKMLQTELTEARTKQLQELAEAAH